MKKKIKAIETYYNGYHFRSRLEARWAVFFDHLGVKYEYEKEGYDLGKAGWYLPDFWLPMHKKWSAAEKHPGAGYWLEIKGINPSKEEIGKLQQLAIQSSHHALLAVGIPGSSGFFGASRDNGEIKGRIDSNYIPTKDPFFYDLFLGTAPSFIEIMDAINVAKSARFEHRRRAA